MKVAALLGLGCRRTAGATLLCCAVLALAGGCASNRNVRGPAGYFGPTETMAQVAAAINANNQHITTLWAPHYYEATIVDDQKHSHFVNGNGVLLYRRPRGLRLLGNKDFAGTVFEVGSNDEDFWLKVVPEVDTAWWGHYRNLGKPCMKELPIRPDLVLEVLGIGLFDTDFTHEPAPVMRFNNDADAYMFVWVAKQGDRWVAQKEIWYDRVSKRPTAVLLFDENGRIILRAYLAKPQAVEMADGPKAEWPMVATEYKLFFPDSGTKISLELSEVRAQNKGVPNERSFRFDPEKSGVSKVIQTDEDCGS